MDRARGRNAVDVINVLRVLAIFVMVYFLHAWLTSNDPGLTHARQPLTFLLKTPAWAGVWILFILSGYLIGKGFYTNRYALTVTGLKKYYLGRLIRIAPPYLLMCLIIGVLTAPQLFTTSSAVWLRLLTFTYNGDPGFLGIGATWYVSTVMQLYLFAPAVFFMARRTTKKPQNALIAFIVVAVGGLSLRLFLLNVNAPWYISVYTPMYANLDLFVCGMLLNPITLGRHEDSFGRRIEGTLKGLSAAMLGSLVVFNCYMYFYAKTTQNAYALIYRYGLPTAYILAVGFVLYSYDSVRDAAFEPLSLAALRRNPLRIIDCLSLVSFEFYLWQSNILSWVFGLVPYVHTPLATHVLRLSTAGVVSLVVAAILYWIIERPIASWRTRILGVSKSPAAVGDP